MEEVTRNNKELCSQCKGAGMIPDPLRFAGLMYCPSCNGTGLRSR